MTKRLPPKGDAQPDLFSAIFSDIPVRDQRDTMERPFFSLAKKPRLTPIEYQVGDVWVEVTPNPKFGMATIWDADILIWAATQITEAVDRGQQASRVIRFHPHSLLRSIRRGVSGKDYASLRNALDRLTHTAVRTNIRGEGKKKTASFHWLEGWTETTDEANGETRGMMTMTMPDWLYKGIIMKGGVLTIHEDYFLLTGGIMKWLYRVARKHAGHQSNGWTFTIRQLYDKSGSLARYSDFCMDIRKAVETDSLPEYALTIRVNVDGDEIIHIHPRSKLPPSDKRFDFPRFPGRRLSSLAESPTPIQASDSEKDEDTAFDLPDTGY